jgi:autotransporter-associated beta strand protein
MNGVGAKLILSGANTYTGATTVTNGILAVNGSLANTSTTVGSGATLQGSGSIAGSVTVNDGGILATGNSIESLATGTLSLLANSTLAYEIDNDALPGVAGDLTAVTGNLTLDSGNLTNLTLTELGLGSWTVGEKLTLISYSGTWNGGLFNYSSSTLADDSTFAFSGSQWSFNYDDTAAGDNYTGDLTGLNFVTMTVIPEPNVAALVGALGFILLLRRRR